MESDSDHFESADENFNSDEEESNHEDHQSENVICNKIDHIDPPISTQIKSLSTEEKPDASKIELLEKTQKIEINEAKIPDNKCVKTEPCPTQEIIVVKTDIKEITSTDVIDNQSIDDKSNKKPRVIEKKERPQKMKSKLGVKLGTRIEKNIKFEELGDTKSEPLEKEDTKTNFLEKQVPQSCWEDEIGWAPFENEYSKPSKLYSQKSDQPEKNYWENEADYMELPPKDNIRNIVDKLSRGDQPQPSASWSSWGNWGVSSILSTASLGVSTLTNSVSQGITTVLETGIGAPDPEELARIDRLERQKRDSNPSNEITEEHKHEQNNRNPERQSSTFGLGNFVSGVSHITKLVETHGTNILSGGLDTLENIGKKTMEVLQEGDPGFKKKKAFLGFEHDKPVLSQVLREAKEKAEEENKFLEERHFAKKAHYETLFDDHQGLVHLEALEMLSKQCDIKLENLTESYSGNELTEFQETMTQIKELCEIPDEDEDIDAIDIETIREKLDSAILELNVNITYEHLLKTWNEVDDWLEDVQLTEREIHQNAIETLAKLTAISVEQFHKAGELLLVKERRSTVDEADSLVQLTTTVTSLIGMAAGKFSEKLNSLAEFSPKPDNVNNLITNIFLEAANSSSYIQDAFQLLIPVLQAGAV